MRGQTNEIDDRLMNERTDYWMGGQTNEWDDRLMNGTTD